MQMSKLLLSLLAGAALVGCSSTKLDEPAPVTTPPATTAPSTSGQTAPTSESKVATVYLGAQLDAAVSNQRVVYFDFDSFVVKDEYRGLIETHAKRLATKKGLALSLEGHADERGGREYNLALGQKRAEAVAKQLSLLGVPAAQVEPVSYGKERPAAQGHNEEAWAKNRRVELRDK